jgi:ABC-type transporter Mla subunit MlaD
VRDQQRLHADVLNGVHELAVKLETLVAALNERCPQREKDIQRLADAVAALIKDSKERDTKMSNRVTGIETVKHRVGGIWLVLGGTLTFLAGLLAMWIGKQF